MSGIQRNAAGAAERAPGASAAGKKKLGIYIHIPFCVRKCAYCDFLSAPASAEVMEQYAASLKQEIRECRDVYKRQSRYCGHLRQAGRTGTE